MALWCTIANSGTELIPYQDKGNFKEFSCALDVSMLLNQVKSYGDDIIELWYGLNNAIKLVNDNVTQVIALLEE